MGKSGLNSTNTSAASSRITAQKSSVRGLREDTTHGDLEIYLNNWGAIDHASVTTLETCAVLKDAESVNRVLNTQPHFIESAKISLNTPDEAKVSLLRSLIIGACFAFVCAVVNAGKSIAGTYAMPTVRNLAVLALFGSLLAYGVGIFVYVICGFLSFAAGFLLFLPDTHWVSLKQKIPVSRGLVEIEDPLLSRSHVKYNYTISGCHELDVVLNQILEYIIDDYIRCWYAHLTNESEFPNQLHAAMAQLAGKVAKRAQRIDWVPFMIEGIPSMVIEHLRIHRRSLERRQIANAEDQIKLFFDEELETEKQICREGICTSRKKELDHLRKVTDVFLFAIMPEEDYRIVTVRYLIKEILVNGVLLPAVNVLADSDFVNQSIIKLCNESAFASPYFIQSLRMSTQEDELRAVKERIEVFAAKLRGHDSGGDDDTLVKAQLNSLNFLENICNSQIAEIKRGLSRRPGRQVSRRRRQKIDAMGSGADALSRATVDFTFDDVMGNDVAVSNFLEFLTSINEQSLLSLYLNCVAYRVNSEELMSSITSAAINATNNPSTTVFDDVPDGGEEFDNSSRWNESIEPVGRLEMEQNSMSAQDRETMEGIRAFGVSMCNLVMKTLPQIPEETVQQCLRSLTTPLESIDPTVFVDVEEELIRLLSSEQCFGAFKRSPFYARAVEELEASDLIESPRRSAVNSGDEVPDAISLPSMSLSSSPSSSRAMSSALPNASSIPSQFYSTLSSSSVFADSYNVNVLSGEMVRDGYVVYTLEVTYLSAVSGRKSVWRTYRRYSQFDDLHSCIIEQCGRIPTLKLPGKKSFSNVSPEFIEKRRLELDEYLQVLCSIDASGKYPKLHSILTSFLQPEKWERRKALHPSVSSLMNPLKAVGSAIISVPDTLFDGFSKMISRRQPSDRSDINGNSQTTTAATSSVNSRSSALSDTTSNLSILDQTDSDNIPFRLLFMLVDEVFSLQRKTQLFRRGALTILRNIVQTFFGDIMNRRIVEKAKHLISAKQMAIYAEMFRDVLWPHGSQAHGHSGNGDKVEPPTRDVAMKLRTRVLCRAVIFGSVAEELASYLGVETTREGVQRLFDLLQQPCLNRRLVHCLFEGVTRLLLPEYADQLNDIYAQDNRRSA
ncbi:Sorting nexin-13 [Taenia crassiceps]|uniref:Sorting nexin-13 n=1 Tax=Taenia crassiceps TaxID=6207 RepID=A0ABR4Q1J4_9CEST